MVGNRNNPDVSNRLFELLMNEISLTENAIEHYRTFGTFWLGLALNFVIAYYALDTGNLDWIPKAVVAYSVLMFIECMMRRERARKLEAALLSQLDRREFRLHNSDANSTYATISSIALKRRRLVTPGEAINATFGKNQDLNRIIQYACKHKYRD